MRYAFRKHRFGFEVRVCREQLNCSLAELSVYTDIDDSTISRIERGVREPTMTEFTSLCNWLDLSPRKYFTYFKR